MKILSITAQKPNSTGSGVYLTELVRQFARDGHEQAVVAGVYEEDRIELPEGVEQYTVNILKGFVFRSWMDYLTFGKYGTGGWASEDGTIQCIESAYDFESEKFTVSLLKHEAQHAKDLKEYPDITPAELEYRAKLVELYYSSDWELLGKFLKMADADKVNDSHAMASMRIKEEFSDGTYEDLEKIKERALELFKINTRELRHGSK